MQQRTGITPHRISWQEEPRLTARPAHLQAASNIPLKSRLPRGRSYTAPMREQTPTAILFRLEPSLCTFAA